MLMLAPKYRFTVDDYYRMAEVGILAPDARVELLEGEIVEMFPADLFIRVLAPGFTLSS